MVLSVAEKDVLIAMVEENINLINDKSNLAQVVRKKRAVWMAIAEKLNQMNPDVQRKWEQVATMWKNLRNKAKSKNSEVKREKKRTGGGKGPKSPDSATQKVIDILGNTPAFKGVHKFGLDSEIDTMDEGNESDDSDGQPGNDNLDESETLEDAAIDQPLPEENLAVEVKPKLEKVEEKRCRKPPKAVEVDLRELQRNVLTAQMENAVMMKDLMQLGKDFLQEIRGKMAQNEVIEKLPNGMEFLRLP